MWLLKLCDWRGILLLPVHLTVVRNTQANALWRVGQTIPAEWAIQVELLLPVFARWETPVIWFLLLQTGRSPCMNHHLQTRGASQSMRCQSYGLGSEWCMPFHHSRCFQLGWTTSINPMSWQLSQWHPVRRQPHGCQICWKVCVSSQSFLAGRAAPLKIKRWGILAEA